MSSDIDEMVSAIATRGLGKQAALERFRSLSGTEREAVLERLRGDVEEIAPSPRPMPADAASRMPLSTIDERSLDDGHLDFIARTEKVVLARASTSRAYAEDSQRFFVDQRKPVNLKKLLKPLQFHLTYSRAEGPYLDDVDGNRYVDITGDNGVNIFGHAPRHQVEAITDRLQRGFPLVGYTEELFEAAQLFCEITGNERVLFTQSGTEAVMWAVRVARAATRKEKIVLFEGSYHGLSDTVVAFRDHDGRSTAAGLGMLQAFADQIIVLEYGNADALRVIEERVDEIAGVLVEPVQSRSPANQPVAFLHALRDMTRRLDVPLIFDEMITGFRACPRGAQGQFGIEADLSTYGKVPGGGMPTGMLAGKSSLLDYVDGGAWSFEDESMPSLRRTMLAGTHNRNPLKLAATLATLREIKRRIGERDDCGSCECFQRKLNRRTEHLCERLNAFFGENRLPVIAEHFSSLFRLRFDDKPNGLVSELFYVLLRLEGVETSVSGNHFLTTTHDDEIVARVEGAIAASFRTLLDERFFARPEDAPDDVSPRGETVPSGELESRIRQRLKRDLVRMSEEVPS